MTPYWKVYDAFLAKTLEDEWGDWAKEETEEDLNQLLESAIPYFKFPRISLERNEEGFKEDLNSEEIQILSTYMKCEWLNRSIMTWENVKPLYEERDFSQANLLDKLKNTLEAYEERDFSQANLLDKLKNTLEAERLNASRLEGFYYRSVKGKSYRYSKLAGG